MDLERQGESHPGPKIFYITLYNSKTRWGCVYIALYHMVYIALYTTLYHHVYIPYIYHIIQSYVYNMRISTCLCIETKKEPPYIERPLYSVDYIN